MITAWWVLWAGCRCGDTDACRVKGGTYYVVEPEGWDGAPLPMVAQLHGGGGSPFKYLNDDAVLASFSDRGALLVLPEGKDGGWGFGRRDEPAFLEAMLDEVERRYPVEQVVLSSHSLGGYAIAQFACELGASRADGFSAVSGGYFTPLPAQCPGAPVRWQRTQGLNDPTWTVDGRAFGNTQQVALEDELAFWRDQDDCDDAVVTGETDAYGVTCRSWSDCDGRGLVRECTHDGVHAPPDGWVDRMFEVL